MKLVPIITPGRASPYNVGIAETFSWIPLGGPVRQFFSQAHYGVNIPNQTGAILTTNTATVTGHFNSIKFITDSVFEGLTAENSYVVYNGITWPAGFVLEGPIRAYKLASGKVLALLATHHTPLILTDIESPSTIVGIFWYSSTNDDWFNLNNWFADEQKTIAANALPSSVTNVVINKTSLYKPYVNIDNILWVEPASIYAEDIGITFYSNENNTISCNITGTPISFLGNSNYSVLTNILSTKYWYSEVSNDWFALSSWYDNSQKTIQSNTLPQTNTNVIVLSSNSVQRPYINLDDNRWLQPVSINVGETGITFYSQNNASVSCQLIGSPINFLGNSTYFAAAITGRYWYSDVNSDWFALSSWFANNKKTINATQLPLSSTHVTILGDSGFAPYVNLDDTRWRQPSSINVGEKGITFYSQNNKFVSCTLIGSPIIFLGNSTYFTEDIIGRFWYSSTSNDWFALSSWFGNNQKTLNATHLPLSTTHVVILSTSTFIPYVNLDDTRWKQPSSINAEEIGITFYSATNINVTCDIYGTPITFINTTNYG